MECFCSNLLGIYAVHYAYCQNKLKIKTTNLLDFDLFMSLNKIN